MASTVVQFLSWSYHLYFPLQPNLHNELLQHRSGRNILSCFGWSCFDLFSLVSGSRWTSGHFQLSKWLKYFILWCILFYLKKRGQELEGFISRVKCVRQQRVFQRFAVSKWAHFCLLCKTLGSINLTLPVIRGPRLQYLRFPSMFCVRQSKDHFF